MLFHPAQAFAALSPRWVESLGIVLALFVTAGLRAAVEAVDQSTGVGLSFNVVNTLLGTLAAWIGLASLLYLIAQAVRSGGRFETFLLWLGYAALPIVLTNLISLLISGISLILLPQLGGANGAILHTGLALVGLLWGWPGLLTVFALRSSMQLSLRQAGAVVLGVLVVIGLGWALPLFFPSAF